MLKTGVSAPAPVTCMRWSADGLFLAIACSNHSAKVLQLSSTNQQVMMRDVQTVQVGGTEATKALKLNAVCWNPTAPQFCFVGADKVMDIWHVRASKPAVRVETMGQNINVDWSPDGKFVAVGNRDDMVGVVDVAAGKMIAKVKFAVEVNEMAWSADGRHILLAHGGHSCGGVKVLQWRPEETQMELVYEAPAHSSPGMGLRLDRGFSHMAIGSTDLTVSLWDLEDLVCYKSLSTFDNTVQRMSFSGDGTLLAVCADESKIVTIYDVTTGTVSCSLPAMSKPIGVIDWHPKRALLATAVAQSSGSRGKGEPLIQLLAIPAPSAQ